MSDESSGRARGTDRTTGDGLSKGRDIVEEGDNETALENSRSEFSERLIFFSLDEEEEEIFV